MRSSAKMDAVLRVAERQCSCNSASVMGMRYRLALLYLFASLLGTPVLIYHAHASSACASIADPVLCSAAYPRPFWVFPLGLASLAVLVYATYLLAMDWTERRHEKELLDGVGVHVREEDLPLEE